MFVYQAKQNGTPYLTSVRPLLELINDRKELNSIV